MDLGRIFAPVRKDMEAVVRRLIAGPPGQGQTQAFLEQFGRDRKLDGLQQRVGRLPVGAAPGHQRRHLLRVGNDGLSPQQVVNLHRPELVDSDLPAKQLVHPGDDPRADAGLFA